MNTKNYACSKIILIGEHAVVYNKPAIAIPLKNITCKVTITENNLNDIVIMSDLFQGSISELPIFLESLKVVIIETLKILNSSKNNITVTIDSDIPLQRGMGSSASVSIAIIRSLFHYFNKTLTTEKTLELVHISEKLLHGNPSGIDATVITTEQAIYFKKNEPFKLLNLNLACYLIIADSGITGSTKEAINMVKKIKKEDAFKHTTIMNHLENLSNQMLQFIMKNHLKKIGEIMTNTHHYLQQLNLSTPLIDKLVSVALKNGALGAKLTGGGLGGCIIALAQTIEQAEVISQKLKENGAQKVFINKI